MNNFFVNEDNCNEIVKYDLKGSTYKRTSKKRKNNNVVFKDLDFIN